MCGNTAGEHTCRCCSGEGRRARERRLYARKKAASVSEPEPVREYRREHQPATPGPGVVIEGGSVAFLPQDPRHAQALAGIEAFGDDVRGPRGQIMWLQVPPDKRWMRAFEGKPEPRPVRLPPGLVSSEGAIDREMLAHYPAEKAAFLTSLLTAAFNTDRSAA